MMPIENYIHIFSKRNMNKYVHLHAVNRQHATFHWFKNKQPHRCYNFLSLEIDLRPARISEPGSEVTVLWCSQNTTRIFLLNHKKMSKYV